MSTDFGFSPTDRDNYYFISYNTEDAPRISAICNALNDAGVPMWYDGGIPHDAYWSGVIVNKVKNCREVVLFITAGIFEKGRNRDLLDIYTYKEYLYAKRYKKKMLIVILEPIPENDIHEDLVDWWTEISLRQGLVAIGLTPSEIAGEIMRSLDRSDEGGMINSIPPAPKRYVTNRFLYNAESSAFYGREAEMDYLLRMCNDSDLHFCWSGICGGGGTGKSRLALELCKKQEDLGWKVYRPSHARSSARRIEEELRYTHSDTLICFDDIKSDLEQVIDFIFYCAEGAAGSSGKIRLIIIDRDFSDSFIDCSSALNYRYHEDRPSGGPLPATDNGFVRLRSTSEAALCAIMNSYAMHNYQKQLSEDDQKMLYSSLKNIDQQERPLFALFISDAWCSGNNVRSWRRNDALDMVINKEYEKALELIKAEYPRKSDQSRILNAVKCVLTISAFTTPIESDRFIGFLDRYYRISPDGSGFQWILEQLGVLEDQTAKNIYPDVVSEYLSLSYINSLSRDLLTALLELLLREKHSSALIFSHQICEDYEDMMIAPSNMSVFQFLNEKLEISIGEQIASGMSDEELEEFDQIPDDDLVSAKAWLEQHAPDHHEIVVKKQEELRDYFIDNKHMIFHTAEKEYSRGRYSGEMVFDWRCGRGRMEYNDKRVYEGQWNRDDLNGFGKFVWPDGNTYEGDYKDGNRNGRGKYTFPNGAVYDGEWANGRTNGHGVMRYPDGRAYEGEWKDGQFSEKHI